jgi:hypothetical protein
MMVLSRPSQIGINARQHIRKGPDMRLIRPAPAQGLLGLRAMKEVASAAGPIGKAQRALMETAKQVLLHLDADIDALEPIDPATLAAGFPDPELREQFVNGLLVVALADGPPAPAAFAKLEGYAEALGVDTPQLRDLRRLAEHHMLLFRLDFLRHSQIGDIMRNQLDQHGVLGLAKSVLGMRGLMEDPELAAKYQAWEKLPTDTLGHALWQYYRTNQFGMPGERSGFPEAGVYHDFSHVLASYGTDPQGEVEVASFTAGYKATRPIYLVLFAVLTFSSGINMRPTAGQTTVSVLAEPGMAARMFAALDRGSQLAIDLSEKWDYWPYVAMPIEEARHRLGIPAKAPA